MKLNSKVVICFYYFLLGFHWLTFGQKLEDELKSKLTIADQKKIEKANEQYSNGIKSEEESNKLLKMIPTSAENDKIKIRKKYVSKRLEAAEFYSGSNNSKIEIYHTGIKKFWKQYSGDKLLLKNVKSIETMANDSLTKASDLRYNASKSENVNDKLDLIVQAEAIEKRFVVILGKVFFSYLNYPIEYDKNWIKSIEPNMPGSKSPSSVDTSKIEKKVKTNKDSLATLKSKAIVTDSIKKADHRDSSKLSVKNQTLSAAKPIPGDSLKNRLNNKPDTIKKKVVTNNSVITKDSSSKAITPKDNVGNTVNMPNTPPITPIIIPGKTNNISKTDSVQYPEYPHITKNVERKKKIGSPNDSSKVAKGLALHNDSLKRKKLVNAKPLNPGRNPKKSLQTNDSSLYGKVAVNEDQIDAFNDFMKKKYPEKYSSYIIDFQKLDYSDINSLRESWYRYLYGGNPIDDSLQMLAESKELNISVDSLKKIKYNPTYNAKKTLAETNKNAKNEGIVSANPKKEKHRKNMGPLVKNEVDIDGPIVKPIDYKDTSKFESGNSGVFVFKMQIAACRVPLDSQTLKGIYNGPEKIYVVHEDHWYKYIIGEFTTYKEARKLKDKTEIPGVFVIAYLGDKRIKITPAIAYKKLPKPGANNGKVNFRVQIAASRLELSENVLKNIYNGNLPIEMINEDGWHKYSLSCGNNYNESIKLLRSLSIPGAFIVAYSNSKKVDVDDAIKLINK